ncbi:MAG: hypothetical protein ACLQNG_08795 [Acidimicrobiales bacterium]
MAADDRLAELAAELERLGEQLADAAMDVLRAGLAEGSDAAAELATRQERLVNRARSSVEKAALLLSKAVAAEEAPAGRALRPRRPAGAGDDGADWETA